jgi:Flp pilus assembly pilin Flp
MMRKLLGALRNSRHSKIIEYTLVAVLVFLAIVGTGVGNWF